MKKTQTTADNETSIARVAWAVVAVGVVATGVAGWVSGPRALLGVALGALIGLANLLTLSFLVRRLIAPAQPKKRWAAAAAIKLVVLLGGVFLLVQSGQIGVLPLILGYAALPLGIVVGQLATPVPVEEES
jgi:hypothetical protein